jgi:hypothetical protein
MGRRNTLTALAIVLTIFTVGVWIGRHWFPPHETEVVEGLAVEKLCWTWTDGCNHLARGWKGYSTTAMHCGDRRKQYKCLSYSWW